jgi:hypothetical protein
MEVAARLPPRDAFVCIDSVPKIPDDSRFQTKIFGNTGLTAIFFPIDFDRVKMESRVGS